MADIQPLGMTPTQVVPDGVALALLEAAACPNKANGCDGEQYPEYDGHGNVVGVQCQWCYERRALLAAPAAGGDPCTCCGAEHGQPCFAGCDCTTTTPEQGAGLAEKWEADADFYERGGEPDKAIAYRRAAAELQSALAQPAGEAVATPSEAVYAFGAALTCMDGSMTVGAAHDASHMARLCEAFRVANNWPAPRDNYTDYLTRVSFDPPTHPAPAPVVVGSRLYHAANKLLAVMATDGSIDTRHRATVELMNTLTQIDGGHYQETAAPAPEVELPSHITYALGGRSGIPPQPAGLGELPPSAGYLYKHECGSNYGSVQQIRGYTADQMRDYGAKCAALARQPSRVVDWRGHFVEQTAMRNRDAGMNAEQAGIHAENEARALEALAALEGEAASA